MTVDQNEKKLNRRKEEIEESRDSGDITEADYDAIQEFMPEPIPM